MTVPTKAELQAELANLRRQMAAMERRAERAESALGASETRAESLGRELGESRQQQAAAGEILRLIHGSPADVTPVFEGILSSAVRLARADYGATLILEGELVHLACAHGMTPEWHDVAQRVFPQRVDATSASGQAIMERRAVFVADAQNSPLPRVRELARSMGYRCQLMVPMLRQDIALGVIALVWQEAPELPPDQLSLLETFADQAVIAIENARLFKELEARNTDLTMALDRQTATAEILHVISSSPTGVQPVFDTIARSASRLCGGMYAIVARFDGELIHLVAQHNPRPGASASTAGLFPRRPGRDAATARAIQERAVVHIPDAEQDRDLSPANFRAVGARSFLAVPMIHEGRTIGGISVSRAEVGQFPPDQVDLLKMFADQAVIAVENVRLFTELETRNRDLTEALAQQTATAEILRAISSSPTDTQPVFDTIVRSAGHLCGAESAVVYRFEDDTAHFVASYNVSPETVESYRRRFPRPLRETDYLWRIADGPILNIGDIEIHAEMSPTVAEIYRGRGVRSAVWVPMRRGTVTVGAINVAHRDVDAFSDARVDLLRTFADQAVIAIENVRLFTELEARNHDLTESLEQQTATSDILKVIASTPTDLTPVFETILRSAVRLFNAYGGGLRLFDGELVHLAAVTSPNPEADDRLRSQFPHRPDRGYAAERSILDGTVVHVPDIEEDPSELARWSARDFGYRRLVSVPMFREGQIIGAINVTGSEPGPYSARQIALLKTFADQAVIAIENVRLFTELEARNRDLTDALEQQTATGEILRVISRSPTDVQPVFDTIAQRAMRLCDAMECGVFRFDGALIHLVALADATPEWAQVLRSAFPRPPGQGSITARAILTRSIVHIPDVFADREFKLADPSRTSSAPRSVLSVPMVRDDQVVGAITVDRYQPEPFSEKQIGLLQTFADQAVIAIENVRLFTELEARNRDLTDALARQTATGGGPAGHQPVPDGRSARLRRDPGLRRPPLRG